MIKTGLVVSTINGLLKRLEKYNVNLINYNKIYKEILTGVLESFGNMISLNKKTNIEKEIIRISLTIEKIRQSKLIEDIPFYIDSGGYQIATGKIQGENIDKLLNAYFTFLIQYPHLYNFAFSLDAPLSNTSFSSWKEIEKINIKTYKMVYSLPNDIRNKIIWVHHSSINNETDIYNNIFKDLKLFEISNHFAMGGLVGSFMGVDDKHTPGFLPSILYFLSNAINHNIDKITLHMLGVGIMSYSSIFLFKLVEKHIKHFFNIDFKITFDEAIMKKLSFGIAPNLTNGNIDRIKILNISKINKIKNSIEIENRIKQNLIPLDIGITNEFKILNDKFRFTDEYLKYISIYFIVMVSKTTEIINKYVDNVFNCYLNNDDLLTQTIDVFFRTMYKTNNPIKYKIKRFLDTIKNLDFDYCDYVVKNSKSLDPFNDSIIKF